MTPRQVEVFFYGLFMDQRLLEEKGAHPSDVRPASVAGFALRIGARAALTPSPEGRVHGVLMKLSHGDIEQLYAEPSLKAYRAEPVLALLNTGQSVAALCFNLPEPPGPDEHNPEYAAKLRAVAQRLGLPAEYIAGIR